MLGKVTAEDDATMDEALYYLAGESMEEANPSRELFLRMLRVANVDFEKDGPHDRPLYRALNNGRALQVPQLLSAGARYDAKLKQLALQSRSAAITPAFHELVGFTADELGLALWSAADSVDAQRTQFLLKLGADVNWVNRAVRDRTPLHAAARSSTNPSVLEELLAAGAETKAVDKDKKTAGWISRRCVVSRPSWRCWRAAAM